MDADLDLLAALESHGFDRRGGTLFVLPERQRSQRSRPHPAAGDAAAPHHPRLPPQEFEMFVAGLWGGDGCVCICQTLMPDQLVKVKVCCRLDTMVHYCGLTVMTWVR